MKVSVNIQLERKVLYKIQDISKEEKKDTELYIEEVLTNHANQIKPSKIKEEKMKLTGDTHG